MLPNLKETLSWFPVDQVAATLSYLMLPVNKAQIKGKESNRRSSYYHIKNPIYQGWKQITQYLGLTLGIQKIISFDKYINAVLHQASTDTWASNRAALLTEFWAQDFVQMPFSQLVINTEQAQRNSYALKRATIIDKELVKKFT
ncbi:hypothetical protein BS50DRAFT_584305 [Corynespora cassiicola Philippines]|uniref:Uncharacterized protein n=1 Tax=Corynespora cassiicola Philippines TaxID=1448308 RepID=A0A2T2P032_CORCC|nr:hypothetical protein BS50DRAFT_584305 [Corynespora cassiicola Philippines]